MAIAVKDLGRAVHAWPDADVEPIRWDDLVAVVHRQMRSLVGPSCDLEDLAQGALEQVLRSIGRFRGEGELSTFTYRICVHVVLNHRRWWRRWLAHFDLGDAADPADGRSSPPELALENERIRRLHAALDRLAPRKRVVLVLSDLEELPGSRVAEILECPEPTVRSRLRQARRELAELLEDDPAFGEEGPGA